MHQVTTVDAAELWFQGVDVTTSDTDLAWLYNIITNLAQQPIQDAITREVAAQVISYSSPCSLPFNKVSGTTGKAACSTYFAA